MDHIIGRLLFEKREYRKQLIEFADQMDVEVEEYLQLVVQRVLDAGIFVKVTRQSGKPNFHISEDKIEWDVLAWIEPEEDSINLHLLTGTRIEDLWQDVSSYSRSATRHTVVAKGITQEVDINTIMEMIKRSRNRSIALKRSK